MKKADILENFFMINFYLSLNNDFPEIFQKLNDYKMFRDVTAVFVPLNQLVEWKADQYGITCKKPADFCVRYYDIEISGREVRHWTQPLFKASGSAVFGLMTKVENGIRKYLIQLKQNNNVDRVFRSHMDNREGYILDVVLSEEGGRFYHEQNRNIILEISPDEDMVLPDTYLWVNYNSLNCMIQMYNCLNIQLRNLLSLIDL